VNLGNFFNKIIREHDCIAGLILSGISNTSDKLYKTICSKCEFSLSPG